MTDPKQPIYDAMNWLGTAMPSEPPDDRDMLIKAYAKVYTIEDRETQQLFLDVIQRLVFRNGMMANTVRAWKASADKLREACEIIGNNK